MALPNASLSLRVLARLLSYPDAELRAHVPDLRQALRAETIEMIYAAIAHGVLGSVQLLSSWSTVAHLRRFIAASPSQ